MGHQQKWMIKLAKTMRIILKYKMKISFLGKKSLDKHLEA